MHMYARSTGSIFQRYSWQGVGCVCVLCVLCNLRKKKPYETDLYFFLAKVTTSFAFLLLIKKQLHILLSYNCGCALIVFYNLNKSFSLCGKGKKNANMRKWHIKHYMKKDARQFRILCSHLLLFAFFIPFLPTLKSNFLIQPTQKGTTNELSRKLKFLQHLEVLSAWFLCGHNLICPKEDEQVNFSMEFFFMLSLRPADLKWIVGTPNRS